MLTIQKTTNYDQFKFLSSNRPPTPRYLIESIQKKDMLEEHPIICTKEMYVIDGQNRLRAAQTLKLPIYYIISNKLDENDIPQCQIQNPWSLHNYLRFYQSYKDDYKFIAEIMCSHTFPIHFVICMCSSQRKPYHCFREGKYLIKKDTMRMRKLFGYIDEIRHIAKEIKNDIKISTDGFEALWRLGNIENYNHEVMLQKCKKHKDNLINSFEFKQTQNIFESLKNRVYDFYSKKERLNAE